MAYRDESEPLKERRETLAKELEQVRSQAAMLAVEERALEEQLDRVNRSLHGTTPNRGRGMMLAMVSSAACAMLGFAAIGRIMTSEIAPFSMYEQTNDTHAAAFTGARGPAPADRQGIGEEGSGFLRVDAPAGTRIFDNDVFLGMAPLVSPPLSNGVHYIRALPAGGGKARTKLGIVINREITSVQFD